MPRASRKTAPRGGRPLPSPGGLRADGRVPSVLKAIAHRRPARSELIDALHEAKAEAQELRERLLTVSAELEGTRQSYFELFDLAPVGYVVLDGAGVVRELNLTACQMLGASRSTLIDHPLVGIVVREDIRRFLDHMRRCRNDICPIETEVRMQLRTGGTLPVQLTSRRSAAGERPLFQTVLIDLTERQRLEEARMGAERERQAREADGRVALARADAKDQFIAVVSHELRTPLTPVLLAARDLARRTDLPPGVRRLLEIIHRNVLAEARLIDDLLEATRWTVGTLRLDRRPVNLHEALGEVIESMQDELDAHALSLRFELAAQRAVVQADVGRLKQVFANLLNNAIKFTPPGGYLRLASADRPEGWVRIEVSDSGIGISPEAIERLFEPFERAGPDDAAARSGLGLGLAICRGIIRQHGGRVWAESAGPGHGASFFVELPGAGSAQVTAGRLASAAEPGGGDEPPKLLLVEDDEDTAAMLAMLLGEHGFRVSVSHSLNQARELASERWDLVVSDISLPDGSGLELLELGDGVRSAATRIALSGYGATSDVEASLRAGFTAHLVKPVEMDQLLSELGLRGAATHAGSQLKAHGS